MLLGAVADDDVVVDADVQQLSRLHELARKPQIFTARRRIAARVIVDQDHASDAEDSQRGAEDFAWVNQGRGQGACGDVVCGHEPILSVEQHIQKCSFASSVMICRARYATAFGSFSLGRS